MRLLIDDDSTCSKDRACAQQPDKTLRTNQTEKPLPARTPTGQTSHGPPLPPLGAASATLALMLRPGRRTAISQMNQVAVELA